MSPGRQGMWPRDKTEKQTFQNDTSKSLEGLIDLIQGDKGIAQW